MRRRRRRYKKAPVRREELLGYYRVYPAEEGRGVTIVPSAEGVRAPSPGNPRQFAQAAYEYAERLRAQEVEEDLPDDDFSAEDFE